MSAKQGCKISRYRSIPDMAGSKNEVELHAVLTSSIMLRRRKADVLSDLPDKRREQVLLRLDNKKQKELDNLCRGLSGLEVGWDGARLSGGVSSSDSACSLRWKVLEFA